MKNVNVRFLNYLGDNTLAMSIADAVTAIVNEYFTKKSRPYLGKDPFQFTAKDAQDPAIFADTANLHAALEAMDAALTVTLGSDILGGVEINPQELAQLISSAVTAALAKAQRSEEDEDEAAELDAETKALLDEIEAFENVYFEEDANMIQIEPEILTSPLEFLEFTLNVHEYLRNVRKANERGSDYSEELTITLTQVSD